MRHLAIRGRATTRDCVLKFLARTGEQGLFRRVLSYLSPPPLPPPATTLNIRIPWVETGEETFFQLKSSTALMKVFRIYALRRGLPVSRLAFSLPGSEVLIEGFQTGADIGLESGDVIDAMLYAEHPVGLREQAAAAAAAAAAAREWLEDTWTEERFLDAENAEEAAARAAAAEAEE